MRHTFFLSCIVIIIIISFGCNETSDKEVTAPIQPSTKIIEYVSFESQGCQPLTLSPTISGNLSINWTYVDSTLEISAMFTTHCSAIMSDSVIATDNKIEIYLWDTNKNTARCICTHSEVFVFNAESPKTIELIIYYKAATTDEFHELGKKTITI